MQHDYELSICSHQSQRVNQVENEAFIGISLAVDCFRDVWQLLTYHVMAAWDQRLSLR